MDAPLVLSTTLDPLEIDGEVYNVDVVSAYPLEFYLAAKDCKMPYDVKIKRVEDLLNKPEQYEGLKFTHLSSNIKQGPIVARTRHWRQWRISSTPNWESPTSSGALTRTMLRG